MAHRASLYLQAHQEEKTSGNRWEALQASLHPSKPIQGRAGAGRKH